VYVGDTHLGVDGPVSSEPRAVAVAQTVLHELGILPLDAAVEASAVGTAPDRIWTVNYPRHRIGGVQVGMEPDSQAWLTIQEPGFITSLNVHEPAADGGSAYPLRDWHQAWSDVMHHRWVQMCCIGPNGTGTVPQRGGYPPGDPRYRMKVDRVFLYYEESQPTGIGPDFLVPFYAFQDSAADFTIGVSALRDEDVRVLR
jgi:hypothetical protein